MNTQNDAEKHQKDYLFQRRQVVHEIGEHSLFRLLCMVLKEVFSFISGWFANGLERIFQDLTQIFSSEIAEFV